MHCVGDNATKDYRSLRQQLQLPVHCLYGNAFHVVSSYCSE